MAVIDHLVLAATDLEAGGAWLEGQLGVPLSRGGRHVRMGTHNRLLRLGERLYLELIAIDPTAPSPGRPRWFALDRFTAGSNGRPRLVHWVARSDDIVREAAACGEPLGEILAMERGDYRWRITVPADGHLPGAGLVPSLIQWDVPTHPAMSLPDAGCEMMKLEGIHPRPALIRAALHSLGLGRQLDMHGSDDGESLLVAYLRTPAGLVELD